MGGHLGILNPATLSIEKSTQIDSTAIISISISDRSLFTGSRSGFVCLLNPDNLEIITKFHMGNPVTAMCPVGDGVIYALQSDPSFHFRSVESPENDILFSMHPNQFDIGCMAIRDLAQSPIDPDIFLALTDLGRAHLYRYARGSSDLAVLRVLTHFVSDGLTQPQVLWPIGGVFIATSDNRSVVAVDVETDTEVFVIDGWEKATRCVAMVGDVLAVGAFDKSIAMYQLTRT
jgi:outer membrane protein assembly factor BamB